MKLKIFFILFLTGVALTQLSAQAISIPYQMGFEQSDTSELKLRWTFNAGPEGAQCVDQWVVGNAACNEGKQSLYISHDGGETACFGKTRNVQIAYCDLTLPDGNYYVCFDWRCFGNDNTKFYAGMGRRSAIPDSLLMARANSMTIPNQLRSFVFRECDGVSRSAYWKNVISDPIKVKTPNNSLRLFFVWASSNPEDSLPMNISANIDNVQICNALSPIPDFVKDSVISCDSVYIMWEGKNEYYELEYRKHGSSKWITHTYLTEKKFLLEGLSEGLYDFRVRGLDLDSIHSAYRCLNNTVIYCPEMHCVNFVELDNPQVCIPTIGSFHNPFQLQRKVDYGPTDMYSRHTVIMDHDLYDKRTDNKLPMVPADELASVRLGNWNWGAECESLTFRYYVDAENAAILLLKYAIVMEDPAEHTDEEKPQFTLQILNQSGEVIDPTCGTANFVAGKDTKAGEGGWHVNNRYATKVYWKEWTTIGLDLRAYDKQWIQIQLITYDCWLQGHYGYAYFTLDCANAKIYSTSCGDDPEISIDAPAGFNYQWFDNKGEPIPAERGGQSLSLKLEPSDTTTYSCVLTSRETDECNFVLSTASRPRYPQASFRAECETQECQNKVRLYNDSHVITKVGDSIEHHFDETCEFYEWKIVNTAHPTDTIFRDDISPVLIVPNEGGRYWATLTAYISNGGCQHDTTIWFDVPKIGDYHIVCDTTICYGDYPLKLGDEFSTPKGPRYYGNDTTISFLWTAVTGCDSVETWNIHVYPQSQTTLPDTTICAGDSLIVDGDRFMYSHSENFVRFRTNVHGCDSTIQMYVHVLDSILPEITMKDIVGDKQYSGEFHFGGTGYSYYYINGERHDSTETDITGLNGGTFVIEFFNDFGCSVVRTEEMTYPCRNLIFQRWGDVLSVMNIDAQKRQSADIPAEEFTSFQWLKDDADIPGATLSYYYAPEGLDLSAEYRVRVVTANGETLVSCPFKPTEYKSSESQKRKIIENQSLVIIIDGVRYNAQGRRML